MLGDIVEVRKMIGKAVDIWKGNCDIVNYDVVFIYFVIIKMFFGKSFNKWYFVFYVYVLYCVEFG